MPIGGSAEERIREEIRLKRKFILSHSHLPEPAIRSLEEVRASLEEVEKEASAGREKHGRIMRNEIMKVRAEALNDLRQHLKRGDDESLIKEVRDKRLSEESTDYLIKKLLDRVDHHKGKLHPKALLAAAVEDAINGVNLN
ncbi:MAG: hypothetical protein J7L23_03375 [Candidatus Diapherotrites archaeon]|nr:hypothetical protein [Candidatus Diapherotrites archaeon]